MPVCRVLCVLGYCPRLLCWVLFALLFLPRKVFLCIGCLVGLICPHRDFLHGSLATSWYVILFCLFCVYTVTFHHFTLFFMHWIDSLCFCLFICAFTSCVFSFVICFVFSCDRWLDQSVLRSKSTALCFNSYFILFYHMLLLFLCISSHLHLLFCDLCFALS